jgi:hypothetical protein
MGRTIAGLIDPATAPWCWSLLSAPSLKTSPHALHAARSKGNPTGVVLLARQSGHGQPPFELKGGALLHDERKRLSAKANARQVHLELRLGELKREIDWLVDAIAKRAR